MLPDPHLFIAVILGLLAIETPAPAPAHPLQSLAGVALCMFLSVTLSRHVGRRSASFAEAGEDRLAAGGLTWATLWPLLFWGVAIIVFGWAGLVQAWVPPETWLLPHILFLLPMIVMFSAGWAAQVPAARRLVERRGGIPVMRTPSDGIKMGLRRNAMLLVPLLVFTGIYQGIGLLGRYEVAPFDVLSQWMQYLPTAQLGFSIVIVMLCLPFVPRIVQRLVKGTPLPQGPKRVLLERAARRIKLAYKDIVVWNTRGRLANAMVVGFTGGTRRIFVTDRLLHDLPEDELLAVFFHEAGHAKRHHLPLFLIFAFALMLVTSAAARPLAELGIPPELLFVVQLAVFWFVILGSVSRRFEREADIYGADHAALLEEEQVLAQGSDTLTEGSARMMRALDHVRRISGRGASHRHGTIDSRIAFLSRYAVDPVVREGFRRGQRRLVLGILGLFGLGLLATALRLPGEIETARLGMRMDTASKAYQLALGQAADEARADRATTTFERAYEGFASAAADVRHDSAPAARVQRVWAEREAARVALDGLDDPTRAQPHYDRVLSLLPDARTHLRPGLSSLLRFDATEGLARVYARAGKLEKARALLERLEVGAQQQDIVENEIESADILRGRVELVRGVVAGAEGDLEGARRRLRALRDEQGTGEGWDIIRRVAARGLARLEN